MDSLKVAHDIPGRLRLRLPPGVETVGLADAVMAAPGVTSCAWSPRTGSLLVGYEPGAASPAALRDLVARHTGLQLSLDVDVPAKGRTRDTAVAGGLALAVHEAAGELDLRVQVATRGLVGLAGLVPLTLIAWALREVARGRAAPLAWSSALWYAHALFRGYHTTAPHE